MLIQILLILGFVLAFAVTWRRFRQNVISISEALLWSLLWLSGIAVTLIPKITERLASLFGVGRGVDLVLYLAVAIQFFLIFKLFILNEQTERKITNLVEREALSQIKKDSDPKNQSIV
ncbi:MAG: DUF2304 domain-containing protein [Patescibacteria group bacterium]|nr:DUF2304 domain-containing protein [Patescibacteria group bacterium]